MLSTNLADDRDDTAVTRVKIFHIIRKKVARRQGFITFGAKRSCKLEAFLKIISVFSGNDNNNSRTLYGRKNGHTIPKVGCPFRTRQ